VSPLEKKFTLLWVHGIKGTTEVVVEHKFHPVRHWRFDFAHVATKIAIEIEGGSGLVKTKTGKRVLGHHVQKEGYQNDCEKYNEATRLGWKVFRLTAAMVNATELEKISAFIKQQPILN
jgi:very-short-patch-repair endonuclease